MYQDFFLPGENRDKNRLEQKLPTELCDSHHIVNPKHLLISPLELKH
jgi:hypothetical protein